MSDSNVQLSDAGRWVKVELDDAELERSLARVRLTAGRRARARRISAGLTVVTLFTVGGFFALSREPDDTAAPLSAAAPQRIDLEDGSRCELFSEETRLVVSEVSPTQVRLRLDNGGARFQVTHRPQRTFQVRAGDVEVSVLGTVFSVEREGERTRVKVDEGRVKVQWPGGDTVLELGDEGWFPPQELEGIDLRAPSPPVQVAERKRPKQQKEKNWRELARRGHFDEAYTMISGRGSVQPESLRNSAQDLFLAADSARLSGHPREALPFLDAILQGHRDDPRAPLAAFTRGRVLLQLRQPSDAARAFGVARELRGNSALIEDALAREVEAWNLAGERERSRQAATEYLKRFPDGRRAAEVRARLESPPKGLPNGE